MPAWPARSSARGAFTRPRCPGPLHGVLDALGGALAPVGRWLAHGFSAVAGRAPRR